MAVGTSEPSTSLSPWKSQLTGTENCSCSGAPSDSSSESLKEQLRSIDEVMQAVAGTGLAPWEIHRPQQFVRDLVRKGGFSGRVLDAGCGIGDNALYIAKACPGAEVVAVDVVPRCLHFASTKAGLRGMRGKLTLAAADLCNYDKLSISIQQKLPYDIVLDSSTFHGFPDHQRDCYVSTLSRLLRAGGLIYMNCMSEEETRPGGPRRISVSELSSLFNPSTGWVVEAVVDSVAELHPTFWGGRGKARLFTIRKL
ncbi:hypothetical protein GPECTOR_18g19 [Gonium pectorale]|uniref:Methyltransferase domain-containing protein n=1 Tax=Gonium pectorale TaxID=33097 RepID=A0A150GJP3_GONPE|nr:hypothetical protein GPECTOR_18g19 [Gonium pectorale]|eukprot:KXZ50038.1 hypothetical protein GPECTOR_18g19 [Gonium pectorale]